jgi:hypothetical protein
VGRKGSRRKPAGLQVCLLCGSPYVIPIDSCKLGDGGRWMLLRCGECGTCRDAIAPRGAARDLDNAIEEGLQEISDTLQQLDRERMQAQAEAFIAALERDLLDPADFR